MPHDILISLILQDLRHNQLLLELEGRGLDLELHYLDLMTPIGRLMGLPADGIPDEFADMYTAFMNQAGQYPVTGRGEGLMELAEKCYATLKAIYEVRFTEYDWVCGANVSPANLRGMQME